LLSVRFASNSRYLRIFVLAHLINNSKNVCILLFRNVIICNHFSIGIVLSLFFCDNKKMYLMEEYFLAHEFLSGVLKNWWISIWMIKLSSKYLEIVLHLHYAKIWKKVTVVNSQNSCYWEQFWNLGFVSSCSEMLDIQRIA